MRCNRHRLGVFKITKAYWADMTSSFMVRGSLAPCMVDAVVLISSILAFLPPSFSQWITYKQSGQMVCTCILATPGLPPVIFRLGSFHLSCCQTVFGVNILTQVSCRGFCIVPCDYQILNKNNGICMKGNQQDLDWILWRFCNSVCSNRGVKLDSWVRCIATWENRQANVRNKYLVAWISKGGSKFDKI